MLLDLLSETFILKVQLPKSIYEAQNIVSNLGFDYEIIDMFPNNCMLYTKHNASKDRCV